MDYSNKPSTTPPSAAGLSAALDSVRRLSESDEPAAIRYDNRPMVQVITLPCTAIMQAANVEFVHGEDVGYDTRTSEVAPCEASDLRRIGRSVRNDDGQMAYELRGMRVVDVRIGGEP